MKPVINEIGNRYGRLTVRSRAANIRTRGNARWNCECDCGEWRVVDGYALRIGHTQSCGCRQPDAARAANTQHGMVGHPAFNSYVLARQRCTNPRNPNFPAYGGRGIEFRFSTFEEFWNHCGSDWAPGLSIDRIDNDGHYEPGNVRWATQTIQGRNQRSNVWLEHDGRRMVMKDWASELGVGPSCLHSRLKKYGDDLAKVLSRERHKPGPTGPRRRLTR